MSGEQFTEDFLSVNPQGQVPVLIHNGNVITESSIISEYVDETFKGIELMPPSSYQRSLIRHWMRFIDDRVHACAGVVTLASVGRTIQRQRPVSDVLEEITKTPDSAVQQMKLSLFEAGVEAPEFSSAFCHLMEFTVRVAEALKCEDWLVGEEFSLADISVLPYVIRLEHLGLDFLWHEKRYWGFKKWLSRIKGSSAYDAAVSSFVGEEKLALMAYSGECVVAYAQNNPELLK